MRPPTLIAAMLFASALTFQVRCLAADNDSMQSPASQPGWTEEQLSSVSQGCIESIIAAAKRSYAELEAGNGDKSKPFPEDQAREMVGGMCTCIARRASRSTSYPVFMEHKAELLAPLLKEATAGGQCKLEVSAGQAPDQDNH